MGATSGTGSATFLEHLGFMLLDLYVLCSVL